MTSIKVTGIAGNLQKPSRTLALVQQIAGDIAAAVHGTAQVFDVVDAGPDIGAVRSLSGPAGETGKIARAIIDADVLVVGSPVYKGSYTGLLKHIFDLIEPQALASKPAVLVATGGSPLHALVVEHQLRPLLSFFAAHTVPTAIYAVDGDFIDYRLANPKVEERVRRAVDEAAALVSILEGNVAAAPAYPKLAAV
jgi:FMN reductase